MYARVRWEQMQPGRLADGVALLREYSAPVARRARGFGGLFVLTDPTTETMMEISLWETEADLSVSALHAGKLRALLRTISTQASVAAIFTVVVWENGAHRDGAGRSETASRCLPPVPVTPTD